MTGSSITTASKLHDLHDRLADRTTSDHIVARSVIDHLFDTGTFTETDAMTGRPGQVITGNGTIDGRSVCVYGLTPAQDTRPDRSDCEKVVRLIDLALTTGRPIVAITASIDGPPDDGMAGVGALGGILAATIKASGVVPQVSVIVGAVRGDFVFPPALADFVVMVQQSSLMLSDPTTVSVVTGEDVDVNDIGGAETHLRWSGLAHQVVNEPGDAADFVRDLLAHLPANNAAHAPRSTDEPPPDPDDPTADDRELDAIIPDSPDLPYDVREIIGRLVDGGELLELQADRAPNVVTGFGQVDGHSVGVVANQPRHLAGYLDMAATEKAARFVRTCDSFNLPILTLVDVPGFVPYPEQETDGLIRCCSKMLHAYGEASVPKITVVLRKGYGTAYLAMGSKQLGGDTTLAWPTARIAPVPASAAVQRDFAARLQHAAERGQDIESLLWALHTEYERDHVNPYEAANLGHLDQVVPPSQTRAHIASALRLLRNKMTTLPVRKHGNIPL